MPARCTGPRGEFRLVLPGLHPVKYLAMKKVAALDQILARSDPKRPLADVAGTDSSSAPGTGSKSDR